MLMLMDSLIVTDRQRQTLFPNFTRFGSSNRVVILHFATVHVN